MTLTSQRLAPGGRLGRWSAALSDTKVQTPGAEASDRLPPGAVSIHQQHRLGDKRHISNYDALQVTAQSRAFHGLTFLSGYTYSHALGENNGSSTQGGGILPSDKNNLLLNYGNIATDLRHHFTFSTTYVVPGMKHRRKCSKGGRSAVS